MATQETKQLDDIISSRRAMMLGGAALAGLALTKTAKAQAAVTDNDVLNFALNLEYLEAEFYTIASTGKNLQQTGIATGSAGAVIALPTGSAANTSATVTVKANAKVPFAMANVAAYALELTKEEQLHVAFLQKALGSAAVAEPNIDLQNVFTTLGTLIGVPTFDPFADDLQFLLGSYIFEDVGVSAYHGGAGLITSKTILDAAVKIHAIEAYHAATVRTAIYAIDQNATALGPAGTLKTLTQKISGVRATLDGTATGTPDDVGVSDTAVTLNGASYPSSTVVNADASSIGWSRTTTQVLAIVYAGGSGKGGFFPDGMNGTIK